MNVIVRRANHEYEINIEADPVASAAELVTALGGEPPEGIAVDGSSVSPAVPMAELGLRCGSVIEIGATSRGAVSQRTRGVFNRPPRIVESQPDVVLIPPVQPVETRSPMRFGWASLIVPVLLGLMMAVLIHPRMAAFALFSPAMLLANWLEDRRQFRRTRRESDREYANELRKFRAQLATAYGEEAARRRGAACLPDDLAGRCGDQKLWERRRKHDDFMQIPVGSGCSAWKIPIRDLDSAGTNCAAEYATLHDVPITVDLVAGAIVGVAGARSRTVALARQMVLQAAVAHGPADLAITIITERAADWDWAKWLPHVLIDTTGRRRIAIDPVEIDAVVAQLEADAEDGVLQLLVVDLPHLASAESTPVRRALQTGAVAGIALAARTADLPSVATTVVFAGRGPSQIRRLDGSVAQISQWTASRALARRVARSLAQIDDPEAPVAGAGLPATVALADVLGLDTDPADTIRSRWQAMGRFAAPIGMVADGPLMVDLVTDGPHALLGGTTGAGKSELLRSLVAGFAVNSTPEELNFVLVDYKGGSAFDACADLPHTVGVVTDLDDHLASRALVCLEAELRFREQLLRNHGVSDIAELSSSRALPRLMVIVDEFAALAKELPHFMSALVGVAQRGRSLGVHLVLATQRPAGVIDDNIKANTNLRIALRVQDAAESVDVIGQPAAASIPRSLPGRGLARLGPTEVVEFQTAHVSGRRLACAGAPIALRPFIFAHEQPSLRPIAVGSSVDPSDLEQIVAACRRVAEEMLLARPRSPWPDPLSARILRSEIGAPGPVFAVADEPQRQRLVPIEWDRTMGNVLLYGLPGSGTTTALAALAMAVAGCHRASELHIYVLDCDDQNLMPLLQLPHVGAVIGCGERERQLRLLRTLGTELERRRARRREESGMRDDLPTIVTMIDSYRGFADPFVEPGDPGVHDLLARLIADGPGVGMFTFVTAKQAADIPSGLSATVPTRYVFRLADRYEYTGLALPALDPPRCPGRAFESGSGREIQVVLSHEDGLAAAVATVPSQHPDPAPWAITVLPLQVPLEAFVAAGSIGDEEWFLPLGIGDSTRQPAGLLLREGEHALIAGPPRSGKTTALLNAARAARLAAPSLRIVAVAPARSALCSAGSVDEVVTVADLDKLDTSGPGILILVDDAELIDGGGSLIRLVGQRSPLLRIVAAASSDAIRGCYAHWTQDLRRSRIGCALRPVGVTDGDLWHTPLPRNAGHSFPVGRGYLVARGHTELVQLGHP